MEEAENRLAGHCSGLGKGLFAFWRAALFTWKKAMFLSAKRRGAAVRRMPGPRHSDGAGVHAGACVMLPAAMAVFFLSLFMTLAPLWAAPQESARKPVARVDGVVISRQELDEAVTVLLPAASYHRNVTPEKRKELEKKALDNLIQEELFYRAGLNKGYRVAKGDVNKRLEEIVKKYPSKKAYREALKKYGLAEADVRKKLDHIMLAQLFLKEEVYKKAEINDRELLAYYEKNREKFQKPESMRLFHILVRVPPEAPSDEKRKLKEKADGLLKRLKKGEDFQRLAWDNSDDPSRVKGGDLGIVHKGRLEAEVENPAFRLKPGELGGVVTSLYGYHILKAGEKFPPQQLPFFEVKEKLKKELEQKEVERRLADLVMSLRENAKIEVYRD